MGAVMRDGGDCSSRCKNGEDCERGVGREEHGVLASESDTFLMWLWVWWGEAELSEQSREPNPLYTPKRVYVGLWILNPLWNIYN